MNEEKKTLELSFTCLEAGRAAETLRDIENTFYHYDCEMERKFPNVWSFIFFGNNQEEMQEELTACLTELFAQQGLSEFEIINN